MWCLCLLHWFIYYSCSLSHHTPYNTIRCRCVCVFVCTTWISIFPDSMPFDLILPVLISLLHDDDESNILLLPVLYIFHKSIIILVCILVNLNNKRIKNHSELLSACFSSLLYQYTLQFTIKRLSCRIVSLVFIFRYMHRAYGSRMNKNWKWNCEKKKKKTSLIIDI